MQPPRTPGGGAHDDVGLQTGGGFAQFTCEGGTLIPLPQGPEDHKEGNSVQGGLVRRPVHSPQAGLGAVDSDH